MLLNSNWLDRFELDTSIFWGKTATEKNYFVPLDGMTDDKGYTVDCKED
jgi:hypothetical protein